MLSSVSISSTQYHCIFEHCMRGKNPNQKSNLFYMQNDDTLIMFNVLQLTRVLEVAIWSAVILMSRAAHRWMDRVNVTASVASTMIAAMMLTCYAEYKICTGTNCLFSKMNY